MNDLLGNRREAGMEMVGRFYQQHLLFERIDAEIAEDVGLEGLRAVGVEDDVDVRLVSTCDL